jgi:hypothetical protein
LFSDAVPFGAAVGALSGAEQATQHVRQKRAKSVNTTFAGRGLFFLNK